MKYITTLSELPNTAHYVVMYQRDFMYLDPYTDTNPKGTTMIREQTLGYIAIENIEELRSWILEHGEKKDFKAFKVNPIEVTFETMLRIQE